MESYRMSTCAGVFAVSCSREQSMGAEALQRERQLNRFLAEVERRANGRHCFTGSCKTGFVTGIGAKRCAIVSWSGLAVAARTMTITT